jgi:AraC-like DNA-binding protein
VSVRLRSGLLTWQRVCIVPPNALTGRMSESLEYSETAPPDDLRPYIKCLWRLSGPAPTTAVPEPIVPDGCVEIVLNVGDAFIRHVDDGSHRQSKRLVAGQITRAITIAPSGRIDLWGIRFHPWSAAAFLGVSASELRDTFLSIDDAQRALDRSFAALEDVEGDDARRAFIIDALRRRASSLVANHRSVAALVTTVSNGTEPLSVAQLARQAGLSVRRVQTLFRDDVGLAPKQLMRISRFQRALAIARGEPALAWSTVAARAGFYDQAHLIHESQDIVGCTPAALLGRDAPLTDVFLVD